MSNSHFAMILATMALVTALPSVPGGTPRQQQIFEYFPDPRYPDQMVNPSFMTVKCTSEGVFPHPHKCTWFYRCHDRIGRGFFHTSYFICESGTEFDDDLDQCIPKSGTCGDEDVSFCRTLDSSCRSCLVGTSQQKLCEYKECYSGGRDAGIQHICEQGKLHDGQNCVEVSSCQMSNTSSGECPLNKLRPTAKWTDQTSSCSVHTGCRNGRHYQETLCTSYYDCPRGAKVHRSCPEGYLFSPQWELCIHPPQACNDDECFPENAVIWESCDIHSGCRLPSREKISELVCQEYSCTNRNGLRPCRPGKVFNSTSKSCVAELTPCYPCTASDAQFWGECDTVSGCTQDGQKIVTQQCQHYSCSSNEPELRCDIGKVFNPDRKVCTTPLSDCTCTIDRAEFWGDCVEVSGCTPGSLLETTVKQCQHYSCQPTGPEFNCDGGQVFNPDNKRCVDPLGICPCTIDRAEFWGDCVDVTGCTPGSVIETSVRQCQHYSCLSTGPEFHCEGDQVFNPDNKRCVDPLEKCQNICTPEQAQKWTACRNYCQTDGNKMELCYAYSCTSSLAEKKYCKETELFDPNLKMCIPMASSLTVCSRTSISGTRENCTPNNANWWYDCSTITGCVADRYPQQQQKLCERYSCEENGSDFVCSNGQKYDSEQAACITPLTGTNCLDGIYQQQPQITYKTWNNQWNES